MSKPLFSICTIFKDEERFLPEFLDIFGEMSEDLVLVDTGSTDRSLEILEERGVSYHSFPWVNDFSAARNYSLSLARGEWIFVVDVDDRVFPEFLWQLRKYLERTKAHALSFQYASTLTLDWKRAGKIIKAVQPRVMVFRNGLGIEYRNPIHETPIPSIEDFGGLIEPSSFTVFHLGYARELHSEKNERNRKMIVDAFEGGDQSPRTTLHYVMATWKGGEGEYDLLDAAFHSSEGSLKERIAQTLYSWLLDFASLDDVDSKWKDVLSLWEERLLSLNASPLILELRKARDSFIKNDPQEALQSYRRVYEGISTESTLAKYRSEILYRLGFLFAVQGDFGSALTYLLEHTHEFGPTARVFHQKVKILAVQGRFQEIHSEFENLPPDLGLLPAEKALEVKKIVVGLKIPNQDDILRKLKNL